MLVALVESGVEVALVVTRPDRRRSRGGSSDPSPVKSAALDLGLAVRTPVRASEVEDEIRALDVDLGTVVAFGQILPVPLLRATRHGFVNVHFSLLPRWRGAAPVERAIIAGDRETGVCVMQMEEGLDTGGVYACERLTIGDDETAGELRERLTVIGAALLVAELPSIPHRRPEPQVGEATYAAKLDVDEFRLDPAQSAEVLARVVRAGNPRPGAWLRVGGRRLKVLRAHPSRGAAPEPGTISEDSKRHSVGLATTDGLLELDEVQPESKQAMGAPAWAAGLRGPVRVDTE